MPSWLKFWQTKVADCDTRDFTDQKREEMLVSDFIGRCLQIEGSAVQCNSEIGTSNDHSVSVPYLKDWHFVKVSFLAFHHFFIDYCIDNLWWVNRVSLDKFRGGFYVRICTEIPVLEILFSTHF